MLPKAQRATVCNAKADDGVIRAKHDPFVPTHQLEQNDVDLVEGTTRAGSRRPVDPPQAPHTVKGLLLIGTRQRASVSCLTLADDGQRHQQCHAQVQPNLVAALFALPLHAGAAIQIRLPR